MINQFHARSEGAILPTGCWVACGRSGPAGQMREVQRRPWDKDWAGFSGVTNLLLDEEDFVAVDGTWCIFLVVRKDVSPTPLATVSLTLSSSSINTGTLPW